MIIRKLYSNLLDWKRSAARKPLILRGARQVGKSHLVRKFSENYSNYVEINFEERPDLKKCFDAELTPQIVLAKLEVALNVLIEADNTLVFFVNGFQ